MTFPHAWRMAAFAAALCALSVQPAQADNVASGSASISNLRYRLIDLDPNDGITPALIVQPGSNWSGIGQISGPPVVSPNYYYPGIDSPALPSESFALNTSPLSQDAAVTRTSSDGSLSLNAGGAGIGVNATLRSQDLPIVQGTVAYGSTYSQSVVDPVTGKYDGELQTSYAIKTTGTGASRSVSLMGVPAGTDPAQLDSTPSVGLTLTPHTLLVIEGTANLSLAADRTSLIQALAQAPTSAPFDGVTPGHYESPGTQSGSGNVTTGLNVTLTDAQNINSYQDSLGTLSTAGFHQYLSYDGSTGFYYSTDLAAQAQLDASNTFSASFSKDWAVQMANLGSDNKNLYLVTTGSVDVGHRFSTSVTVTDATFTPHSDSDPVGTIPEPGTYALMGLGLAGIALARRRARP